MSATVHVIARLTARPEAVTELQKLLFGLLEPTRRESGCLRYALLHNAADPTDFTFVEEWVDALTFWFAETVQPLWFAATPDFDEALRARFLATYRAAAGRLTEWETTAEGALALTIVLDQFPLNLFRGRPESFATEAAARTVADRAITRVFDRTLPPVQRQFLYLPFMHGEALADQERSVRLYQQAGLEDSLRCDRHHHALIRRFGRFPHRNALLGRASTAEECAYLASPEAFHG